MREEQLEEPAKETERALTALWRLLAVWIAMYAPAHELVKVAHVPEGNLRQNNCCLPCRSCQFWFTASRLGSLEKSDVRHGSLESEQLCQNVEDRSEFFSGCRIGQIVGPVSMDTARDMLRRTALQSVPLRVLVVQTRFSLQDRRSRTMGRLDGNKSFIQEGKC